jgi:hAT family protein
MLEKIQKDHYETMLARDLDEVDEWLSSPPIQEQIPENLTAEEDAQWLFTWWRTNRYRYPRMARIARRYLSIPTSEVGRVERLFSRGRDLLGLRRYALQPGTMKMLTILKASYSDDVFRKALADLSDEAVAGAKDVKRVVDLSDFGLHRITQLERLFS